jgi:hypothetical protein
LVETGTLPLAAEQVYRVAAKVHRSQTTGSKQLVNA